MSTEQGSGERSLQEGKRTAPLETKTVDSSGETATQSKPDSSQQHPEVDPPPRDAASSGQGASQSTHGSITPLPSQNEASASAAAPTDLQENIEPSRQVIAVSASKGPAAFFNLARKFLATDEMCDLSALEGAIVSAVDAAHLLERSQLATIVSISTSYVTVEPKRRKQPSPSPIDEDAAHQQSQPATSASVHIASPMPAAAVAVDPGADSKPPAVEPSAPQSSTIQQQGTSTASRAGRSSGRELRRARIVITVRRTESYKRWLEENPLQAIIASENDADTALEQAPGGPKKPE